MHHNWRDCQEWKKEGLELSTTSNEAAKMYDAAVTQCISWYDDETVGGIGTAMKRMLEEDPEFVMGHVVTNGLELIGTGRSARIDADLRQSLALMLKLATANHKRTVTSRERRHVDALMLFSEGDLPGACDVWEEILLNAPTDILALKFAQDGYFYLGYQKQMRDSLARVLPRWSHSTPLYGYVLGMYSFGLCETALYEQAEVTARKGLEINQKDAWSTHTVAHVMEMQGRQDEGLTFLSSTVNDWQQSNFLSCHLHWHSTLFHMEKGDHEAALDVFDKQIGSKAAKTGGMLDIVDACSLLYRLQLEGVDVGDRWRDIHDICRPHSNDHVLAFNDVHFLMSFLGCHEEASTEQLMKSVRDYVNSTSDSPSRQVMQSVGLKLCEAMVAYDAGDYQSAVESLLPIKYRLQAIGGSDAQRDVFSQLLIHAALRSPKLEHKNLARSLLYERKALKNNSPLTDRLMAKAMMLIT